MGYHSNLQVEEREKLMRKLATKEDIRILTICLASYVVEQGLIARELERTGNKLQAAAIKADVTTASELLDLIND
jgi:hypothetical protein